MKLHLRLRTNAAILAALAMLPAARAGDVYYQCPGNVFTNTISAAEASAKGCKAKEAKGAMTLPAPRTQPARSAEPRAAQGGDAAKVASSQQQQRDKDAKRILGDELRKEEAALEQLRSEYNNGQPERRGDERNYQKYLDRTAGLKATIERKEADVAALKREIGKLD